MTILLFRAFYQSSGNSFPMTFPQLSGYIWMQQAFLAMFMAWFYDQEIFDGILQGGIAYELSRPCDLLRHVVCKKHGDPAVEDGAALPSHPAGGVLSPRALRPHTGRQIWRRASSFSSPSWWGSWCWCLFPC